MPVNLEGRPLYTPQGREDYAHFQNQGANRVNADLEKGIQPPPAAKAVLDRAGWDGQPLGLKAKAALCAHADQDGHSFDRNLTVAYPEYDADPNNNPGEPTPTPTPGTDAAPSVQQIKDAEEFGRANVRQDILEHIKIMTRKRKSDGEIVAAIQTYCSTGAWPASGGGGGTGTGGFHVPGSSS